MGQGRRDLRERIISSGESSGSEAPERQAFRRALLTWFDGHQRDLPWRHVDNPYAVWVSEIMLQQTRVATVVDYFERWMERFPTVQALAESDVEDVLEMWSGLGYYRRARFLHRGAGEVVENFGGRLPERVSELEKLPGIGPYTAGAIASIAFGKAAPLVDGNVIRVISRLYAIAGDPKRSPAKKLIWKRAGELVDSDRPGDFNQGLMELGSELCTARNPDCENCPVSAWCEGYAIGSPELFPETAKRAAPQPMRARSCVIHRDLNGGRSFLLRRRPSTGLLAGLWEFPSYEKEGKSWPRIDALTEFMASGLGVNAEAVRVPRSVGTVEHIFSHRRLQVRVHDLAVDEDLQFPLAAGSQNWRWVKAEDLAGVASSALLDKIQKFWSDQR